MSQVGSKCSLGGCEECLARLGAQLGFPDPEYSFYDGIKKIVADEPRPVITEDSETIILSGEGTVESPLVAELAPTAISSDDGSIVVTQSPDGAFDLSAVAQEVATEDTATIVLDGNGSAGDPLRAIFAPGAVVSTDGSVTVTQGVDGVVDLSAPEEPLSTADTNAIVLNGDGSAGSPLTASFAPGAFTSTGGTVAITEAPNGTINLEAAGAGAVVVHEDTLSVVLSGDGTGVSPLVAQLAPTAITSPDGTVTVIQGTEGEYLLSVPAQLAVTDDTDSVLLSGTGVAGDPLLAQLAPTAITSSDGTITVTPLAEGAVDLSANPQATVTDDTDSVLLLGTGVVGDPLLAQLAPTAITSPDGSVVITPLAEGAVTLSVPDQLLVTDDSDSVLLSGTGVAGDPLLAQLSPTAITSPDGSVVITPLAEGAVTLSVPDQLLVTDDTDSVLLSGTGVVGDPLLAQLAPTAITSPDGTIIVTPTTEGAVTLSAVNQPVANGDTASVLLSGTGLPGNPLLAELASTAITSSNASGNITYGAGGVFDLTTAIGSSSFIPNTVVVGGTIGTTPTAATIQAAIALIPPAPLAVNWNILMCPGSYAASATPIPDRVNLIALQRGSVTITSTQAYTITGSLFSTIYINGITFDRLDVTSTGKSGGLLRVRVNECTIPGGLFTMRTTFLGDLIADLITFDNCNVADPGSTTTLTCVADYRECNMGAGVVNGSGTGAVTVAATAIVQVSASRALCTFTIIGRLTVVSSVLGRPWEVTAANTTRVIIDNCTVNTGTVVAPSFMWTLTNRSATAYVAVRGTKMASVLNKLTATTWSLTQPNLPPSAGALGIDRDISYTLFNLGATAQVTLEIPLLTAPFPAAPGTGIQPVGPTINLGAASSLALAGNVAIAPGTTTATVIAYINTYVGGTVHAGTEIISPSVAGSIWFDRY